MSLSLTTATSRKNNKSLIKSLVQYWIVDGLGVESEGSVQAGCDDDLGERRRLREKVPEDHLDCRESLGCSTSPVFATKVDSLNSSICSRLPTIPTTSFAHF